VFGKLGAGQLTQTLSDWNFAHSEKTGEVYAGVGGQYKLNQKVALTLEYERYGKDRKRIGAEAWTVGAKYAF
jgi:opacity protein-like surface antigen